MSRTLRRTAVRFERAAWAAVAGARSGDEPLLSLLDRVVDIRHAVHNYTRRLDRLFDLEPLTTADSDPAPIQPDALEGTWAAVSGLVADIHRLTLAIEELPWECWGQGSRLAGGTVTARELANEGAHEVIHRLIDIEQLADSTLNYSDTWSDPEAALPGRSPLHSQTGPTSPVTATGRPPGWDRP